MKNEVCKRCGKCCYLLDVDGKQTNKACRFLVPMGNNRYICRIYKSRLGKDIGNGNRCILRKDSKLNYDGCPFNVEEDFKTKFDKLE